MIVLHIISMNALIKTILGSILVICMWNHKNDWTLTQSCNSVLSGNAQRCSSRAYLLGRMSMSWIRRRVDYGKHSSFNFMQVQKDCSEKWVMLKMILVKCSAFEIVCTWNDGLVIIVEGLYCCNDIRGISGRQEGLQRVGGEISDSMELYHKFFFNLKRLHRHELCE